MLIASNMKNKSKKHINEQKCNISNDSKREEIKEYG
jgi:hypothetical protein